MADFYLQMTEQGRGSANFRRSPWLESGHYHNKGTINLIGHVKHSDPAELGSFKVKYAI